MSRLINSEAGAYDARPPYPQGLNDSRATVRYALRAPVTFTWLDENCVSQKGQGWTRDISPRGEYVVAAGCPCAGAAVTLHVCFPILAGVVHALRMEAKGRVLRVDPAEATGKFGGFSIQNERMTLCAD
jgi:hypothetical protein